MVPQHGGAVRDPTFPLVNRFCERPAVAQPDSARALVPGDASQPNRDDQHDHLQRPCDQASGIYNYPTHPFTTSSETGFDQYDGYYYDITSSSTTRRDTTTSTTRRPTVKTTTLPPVTRRTTSRPTTVKTTTRKTTVRTTTTATPRPSPVTTRARTTVRLLPRLPLRGQRQRRRVL